MAIIVTCSCGKKFKAKDSLAGKRVRCPGCKSPITVGDEGPRNAKSRPEPSGFDPQEALAKYEAAQRKKQQTAEEEAARQEEKNKLIESYDQLVGKKKKKGQKKDELAEEKPKKPTVVVKAADAGGTFLSNPWVKYLIIAGLLFGGAYGSITLVRYLVSYTQDQTTVQPKAEDQIKQLEIETRRAIAAKDFAKANDLMRKILDIDPGRERHRNYKMLQEQLNDAMKGG